MRHDTHNVLPWPNNHDTANLASVVRMMAWAVRHQRPLDQAVNSLVKTKHGGTLWSQVVAFLRLPLPVSGIYSWLGVLGFEERVRLTAEALHHGDGPATALQSGFRHRLPKYVFESLTEAERTGRLPETLTAIADQLDRRVNLNFQCARTFDFALLYLTPMIIVTTGLMIFIMPKFEKIAYEMGGGSPNLISINVFGAVPWSPVWTLLGLWAILGVIRTAGKRSDAFTSWIPGVGTYVRQVGRQSAASVMQAALTAGHGMEDALLLSERCLESGWTKMRLREFGKQLSDGTPWAEAWSKAGLSSDLDNLLLRGAALREDPAAGFGDVVALQRDRLNRLARIFGRTVSLGMTILAGALGAILATDVFRTLIQIVDVAGAL
jgi:hypothetical protein